METYDFQPMKRGDSFEERSILTIEQPDGTPAAISSAIMQVKTAAGMLVHEWSTSAGSITIGGTGSSQVTLHRVAESTTRGWPTGKHRYDIELTLSTGQVITPAGGVFPVDADISIPS